MCLHAISLLGKVCGKIYKSRMYVEKHKKKHIDKKEMSGETKKIGCQGPQNVLALRSFWRDVEKLRIADLR